MPWIYSKELGQLVDRDWYYANQPRPARSDLKAPMYISDTLGGSDGMLCMADGKTYDSKSKYYAAVKAAGCEIVGNEPLTRPGTKSDHPDGIKEDLIDVMKKNPGWALHNPYPKRKMGKAKTSVD